MKMVFRFTAIAAVALLVLPGMVSAQGRMSAEQMQERFDENFKELSSKLALSDEQAPAVRTVLQEQQDKRQEMMTAMRSGGGFGGGREGMRENMEKLQEETTTKLAGILNEAQLAGYKEFVSAQNNRPRGNGNGRRNGASQ